jgi:hypothetical protein
MSTSTKLTNIEKLKPQTTVMASGCNISAPSLQPTASGIMLTTVLSVFIKVGSSRKRAAATMGAVISHPFPRSISIYSTSNMALLTTMPTNMIMPSKTEIDSGRAKILPDSYQTLNCVISVIEAGLTHHFLMFKPSKTVFYK